VNKKIVFLILALVFSISLFLRLYRIDLLSLYVDEAVGHYLLNTVDVQRSAGLPYDFIAKLFWRSYTLTWLLGYSALGVRLLAAVYGAIITLSICLIVPTARKNKIATTLLTASLAAFLPWSFMISRIGYSNIPIIITLILLHLYFFLKASTIRGYLMSLVFLFLALPYYQSMVIIVPLISFYVFLVMLRVSSRGERKILSCAGIILVTLVSIPVAGRFRLLSLSGRGLDLAIWRDVNTTYDTDKYRALSWDSSPSIFSFNITPEQLANKLFLNRINANLSVFTRNYLSFFSPEWLFLKGDAILRHSTGMVGAFYPFLLPFMLYGAFRFFKTADPKTRNFFLVWILVSPIPAALTKDGAGYLLRAVTMLPFLTYFCALGIVDSFSQITKKWRWPYGIVVASIGFYSAWSFFYGYFHVYPALSARAYEYGFKELSDFQVSHNNAPMLVVWDGYYHNGDFRFWQRTPFDQYEAFKLKQIVIGESTFWQTFGNLYFSAPKTVEDIVAFLKENPVSYIVLPDRYFVKYPEEIKELLTPVKEIKYPDRTTALEIFTPKLDKKMLPR